MIYFTSDTHFHHANVLKYCRRPFSDVQGMNAVLIAKWNSTVRPEDEVYHLGDFGFSSKRLAGEILDQLNGRKYLVRGNHDHKEIRKLCGWQWVKDYYELKVRTGSDDLQTIVLCHYPIESWNGRHHGAWHLHGHCHGSLLAPSFQRRMDVGVDPNNYRPLSFEDVAAYMSTKRFAQLDHHVPRVKE